MCARPSGNLFLALSLCADGIPLHWPPPSVLVLPLLPSQVPCGTLWCPVVLCSGGRAKRASAVDASLRALGIEKVAEVLGEPLQWAQLEPLLCAWLRDCHLLVRTGLMGTSVGLWVWA